MHILLGLIGVISAAAFWIWRARYTADALREAADLVGDAQSAARRFGFRRKSGVHPADAVEDPRLAAAGVCAAIATIDGPLTDAEISNLNADAARIFSASADEAAEIIAFGRWVADQCGTSEEAVRRLARTLRDRTTEAERADLVTMASAVAADDERSRHAIVQLRRALDLAGSRD